MSNIYNQRPQSPPPGYPQPPNYGYVRPPGAHPLAIVSMIFGIISLVLVCCMPLNIILGITAVVTGHIGVNLIANSGGTKTGRGMAIAGLVTGYLSVIGGIGFFLVAMFVPGGDGLNAWQTISAPKNVAFENADSQLELLGDAEVGGNSPEARQLAEAIQAEISTDEESFPVWCELRSGRCAVLVSNPFLDESEKEAFGQKLWTAAQSLAKDPGGLAVGDELAVGIRDLLNYSKIIKGKIVADPEGVPRDGIDEEIETTRNPVGIHHFFSDETTSTAK